MAAAGLLAAATITPAQAQVADLVSPDAFRVCADPANLPFSNEAGEGFENKIAELVAAELGRDLQYTWFPMAQGFVRQTLTKALCDVIIGYAQGDELVLNTNAYYTSVYVLIAPKDSPLAGIASLSDPALQGKRLGVIAGTPPTNHMTRLGLLRIAKTYPLMVDTRHYHPNQDMLADLEAGTIDAAVMWGPIGGYLAKSDDNLEVTPLLGDPSPPRLFYRITMGVRQGEDRWKRQLNSTIRKLQPQIDAILRDYGVPLVDDEGRALKPATSP